MKLLRLSPILLLSNSGILEATLLSSLVLANAAYQISSDPGGGNPTTYTIVACNDSNKILAEGPLALSLTQPDSNYQPTILNYSPNVQSSVGDENYVDIGTRINSPSSPSRLWIPNYLRVPERLKQPPNFATVEGQVEKLVEVENSVRFFLFTKENPVVSQVIKIYEKSSLNESHFSSARPTKLIFHGFTTVDAPGEWINGLKKAYLDSGDVNVIVADFSSLSIRKLLRTTLPIFASKRLAELILFLESDAGGAKREDVHLIARSYAVHVAGLTGRLLDGRLGRITALEPEDKISINGAPEYRLTKFDASFVDAVHVNGQRFFFHGARFGLKRPMGHADIYPSIAEKGLGCPGENLSVRRFSARFCQLGRGVRYFTESISRPDSHPMCACKNYQNYIAGQCSCHFGKPTMFMGEKISKSANGVFQLLPMSQENSVFRRYGYFNPLELLRLRLRNYK